MLYGRGEVEILSRHSGLNDQFKPIRFRQLYVVLKQDLKTKLEVARRETGVAGHSERIRLLAGEHEELAGGSLERKMWVFHSWIY